MELFNFPLLFFLSSFGCFAASQILEAGPKNVLSGGNVTLKVQKAFQGIITVAWSFSNNPIDQPVSVLMIRMSAVQVQDRFKGKASADPKTGDLTLINLDPADSGDYDISMVTETDGGIGAIRLNVLEPLSNVVIKSSLTEVIEHNSTVVLTCSAKGTIDSFTWMSGTVPFVSDGKRVKVERENLTITDILQSDHNKLIRCIVKNKLQEKSSANFTLEVFYGPKAVDIDPKPTSGYVSSKSNFTMRCVATSYPPATFEWFHNQKSLAIYSQELSLKTIEEKGLGKELGNYTCVAKNAKTKRVLSSPVVTLAMMEPITGATLTGPTGILIDGNGTANLSCQAKSGKVTKRVWLKDNRPLAESSRVAFSANMSSLSIKTVGKEDNGNYTCRLINAVSSPEAYFNLVVNYGPEPAKLEGKGEVELEDKVELTCSAPSVPPASFVWKLNGTVIPGKTKDKLTIEKAAFKNSGTYTCEATNSVTGKVQTSAHTLTVKEEIHEGLPGGAIAGIVIACLVVVAAIIGLVFYCRGKVPKSSRRERIDLNSLESPY